MNNNIVNKYGAILSPPDERDHIAASAHACADLPEQYKSFIPEYRKNQGTIGSCVGHALAVWTECQIHEKTGRQYSVSPSFIYGNRRRMEHKGEGMVVREALDEMHHDGVMRLQEFDAAGLEVPDVTKAVDTYRSWLEPRGLPQVVKEYIREDEADTYRLKNEILKYDYAVVVIPIYSDSKLDQWNIYRHKGTDITDYHCVLIYGWNKDGWLFVNSWGHEWGNNGCAVLSYDYAISEAWCLVPGDDMGNWYSDQFDDMAPNIPYMQLWEDEPIQPFEGKADAQPKPEPKPEPAPDPSPAPEPSPAKVQLKGIDVSKHQGTIDWNKVKADGIQFALIRAGWTHYEGGLTVDEKFYVNIENAQKAGIDVGIYVYSYDHSVAAAKIAAKKVLELIKPYKLTYPVIFDMEYEDFNKTTGKGKLNTDICIAFLDEVEKAGYYSMLYASSDFLINYVQSVRLEKYDKWVADYRGYVGYKGSCGIWQHSNKGRVNGIGGNVDLDWSYVDYPTLIREKGLNNLNQPKPEPKPEPAPSGGWKVETGPFKDVTKLERAKNVYLLSGYNAVTMNTAAGDASKVQVAGLTEDKAKEIAKAMQTLTGWQTNAYKVV